MSLFLVHGEDSIYRHAMHTPAPRQRKRSRLARQSPDRKAAHRDEIIISVASGTMAVMVRQRALGTPPARSDQQGRECERMFSLAATLRRQKIDEVGDVRAVLPAPASLAGLKGIKRGAVEQTLLCSRA